VAWKKLVFAALCVPGLVSVSGSLPAGAAPILFSFVGMVEATGVDGPDASELYLPGVVSPGDPIEGTFRFDPTETRLRAGQGGAGFSVHDLLAPGAVAWTAGTLDFVSHPQGAPWPDLEDPPTTVLGAWVFGGPGAGTLAISAVSFAEELLLHGLPGFVQISLFFTAPDGSLEVGSVPASLDGLTLASFEVLGLETASGSDVMWSFGGSGIEGAVVPEPASGVLVGVGLAALGLRSRRLARTASRRERSGRLQAGSDSTPK
jgi:hypothetical protein